jgi:methyltransferase (TIGR00027 family)
MQEQAPSRTAMATALMRSLHTRADPLPLIDDPWGERLVPPAVTRAIAERLPPGASVDGWLRANPAYCNVITRSRYSEDALAEAVARGVRQVVMIGAGFDSYALRRPEAAREVQVFEIDHPATQGLKRSGIAACGLGALEGLHFLAADLSRESLGAVLARSSFSTDAPAFFSWLGVTVYLDRETNLATLRAIAGCAAPGSELVFSYVDQAVFGAGAMAADFQALTRTVADAGEPFVSGFDPATLAGELQAIGLELMDDRDDNQLVAGYDPQGLNGLRSSNRSRIARVRVPA